MSTNASEAVWFLWLWIVNHWFCIIQFLSVRLLSNDCHSWDPVWHMMVAQCRMYLIGTRFNYWQIMTACFSIQGCREASFEMLDWTSKHRCQLVNIKIVHKHASLTNMKRTKICLSVSVSSSSQVHMKLETETAVLSHKLSHFLYISLSNLKFKTLIYSKKIHAFSNSKVRQRSELHNYLSYAFMHFMHIPHKIHTSNKLWIYRQVDIVVMWQIALGQGIDMGKCLKLHFLEWPQDAGNKKSQLALKS